MAEASAPRRHAEDSNRVACKQRYSDREEVRKKWLKEYGNIDEDGDYQRNKACLAELFNLLDYVADNALQGYLQRSTYLGLSGDGQERWQFHDPSGDRECTFKPLTGYSSRIFALNLFLGSGHRLPQGVNKETRLLRNDLTHINATMMADQLKLDMDSLWQPLHDIGTALFQLGMLERRDIVPSFDSLRVKKGKRLCGGKYTVDELIGEGGMSRVYRGYQQDGFFERDIAIKELKPDRYLKETIRNECAVMIRLKHSHIPAIYDAFSQNGTYYIIMELINGETLSAYLQAHRLTDAQKDRIADGLCDVLSYLHADGCSLVYADLKPDNILIGPSGDPYLIDFGISRAQNGSSSQRYLSPKWSAPEVLAGKTADQRADVYALGKVLSEVYQLAENTALGNVLAFCTANDPNSRFSNIQAVSFALKEARGPQRVQPETDCVPDQKSRPVQPSAAANQRRPIAASKPKNRQLIPVLVLVCTIIILAAALLGFLLFTPEPAPAVSPGLNPPKSNDGYWSNNQGIYRSKGYVYWDFYTDQNDASSLTLEFLAELDENLDQVKIYCHCYKGIGYFGYDAAACEVTLNYADGTTVSGLPLKDAHSGEETSKSKALVIDYDARDPVEKFASEQYVVPIENPQGLVSMTITNIRLSENENWLYKFEEIPIVTNSAFSQNG